LPTTYIILFLFENFELRQPQVDIQENVSKTIVASRQNRGLASAAAQIFKKKKDYITTFSFFQEKKRKSCAGVWS